MENLVKRWKIAKKIPAEIDQALGEHPPFLRQILYNRGVQTASEARRFLEAEPGEDNPYLLKDMVKAVACILAAIRERRKIIVYGDYDVDGVTGTALLVEALRTLGGEASPFIPNRFEDGYGLSMDAFNKVKEMGAQLVITVDCGIRSPREAEEARRNGIELIITDHHQPAEVLPQANAVICQKQPGDPYPDKELAGVGLAYKLAQALFEAQPVPGTAAEDWLDLVALGTVADVVSLRGENRSLVRRGLARLRQGQRQGIVSLVGASGGAVQRISPGDIGFMLGPRLNAAGRLESALAALNLLLAQDPQEAGRLAQELDEQNRRRQVMTAEMQKEAEARFRETPGAPLIFALYDEGIHKKDSRVGVVGLVASRLVETYYRPAIAGCTDQESGVTRCSCRSIREFHITQALDECADLMVKHGGHAMAAGFTVKNENLEALKARLVEIAVRELDGRDLAPELKIDLEIPLRELHPKMLPALDRLQPTGMDNPDVVFVSRNLQVMNSRTVGTDGKHLRLTVTDGRITYNAIAFRQGHWKDRLPGWVDLAYHFERNEFNGNVSLQLNVRDLKPSVPGGAAWSGQPA